MEFDGKLVKILVLKKKHINCNSLTSIMKLGIKPFKIIVGYKLVIKIEAGEGTLKINITSQSNSIQLLLSYC